MEEDKAIAVSSKTDLISSIRFYQFFPDHWEETYTLTMYLLRMVLNIVHFIILKKIKKECITILKKRVYYLFIILRCFYTAKSFTFCTAKVHCYSSLICDVRIDIYFLFSFLLDRSFYVVVLLCISSK